MHFQCNRADFVHGLSLVEKAVATTDTVPVITGIQLEVTKDYLILTATNLEIMIQTKIPCQSFKKATRVLDGKLLPAIIRKLPDEPVIVEQKENSDQVDITAGTSEFSIHSLAPDDFPELPKSDSNLISLEANTLHTMIKNTVFATSQDETRPYLNGVLFELDNNQLRFTATDSNRLATYSVELSEDSQTELKAIIPAKTLNELNRSVPQDPDLKVGITQAQRQLVFSFDHTVIVSRLIDGQFPNYRSVIPGEQPIKISTKRRSLLAAVDRAALMDQKGSQPIILEVTDGVLEIKTTSSERGTAFDQLNVEHSGQNGRAAFSPRYVMDMLKNCDAEQVSLEYNSDLRQAVLRPADSTQHIYVLMPIRV